MHTHCTVCGDSTYKWRGGVCGECTYTHTVGKSVVKAHMNMVGQGYGKCTQHAHVECRECTHSREATVWRMRTHARTHTQQRECSARKNSLPYLSTPPWGCRKPGVLTSLPPSFSREHTHILRHRKLTPTRVFRPPPRSPPRHAIF